MTHRLEFKVTLTLRSPFLFRGLAGARFGIDTPHLLDEKGHPIIPADQVRGVFREALNDLADAGAGITKAEIGRLFGTSSDDALGEPGKTNVPNRAWIDFTDLTARDCPAQSTETTRIEIDEDTGAAKTGMLQVIELVAPFGQKVRFEGSINVFGSADQGKGIGKLFNNAVGILSSIGAFKSPGFGEVVVEESRVALEASIPLALPIIEPTTQGPTFHRLRVTFDRPLLVDAEKIAENAVRGSSIVPGAVFKGALAQRLTHAGENTREGPLGRALSQLSLSHAFPESDAPGKPFGVPLPLSLAAAKDEQGLHFYDMLSVPDEKGALICGQPARFMTDWKEDWFEKAARVLGREPGDDPAFLPRTHTKINGEKGIAEDTALFTTIARSVLTESHEQRGWLIDVDLAGVDADVQPLAQAMVKALVDGGLDGIGKTGARATFKLIDGGPPEPVPVNHTTHQYAVMLVTSALILDAADLVTNEGWSKTPREAYQAYWADVLPGAELVNFYAKQAYRGGYLARRRRLYGPNAYFPFLLTEPGSIFLIETRNTQRLDELCRRGLPVAWHSSAVADLSWENCPYVPENGYGRICVFPFVESDHSAKRTGKVVHA